MGLLSKIAANRPPAAAEPVRPADLPPRVAAPPLRVALPPPIACLICECPAVWISVYDIGLDDPTFRCCLCEPPPAWLMVAGRWLLVGADAADRRWEWWPWRGARAGAAGTGAGPDDPHHLSEPPLGTDVGAGSDANSQPLAELTASDGSRFTFYGRYSPGPGPGWSDLIRLWIKHGEQEAWSMLEDRTRDRFARIPAVDEKVLTS